MKREHRYYVYILTNKRNGTLYMGVTNNLFSRGFQHKLKENKDSFTAKYNIDKLVYYEMYQYIGDAIVREKQLKRWQRQWKIELIEKDNPTWRDLFYDMTYVPRPPGSRVKPGMTIERGFAAKDGLFDIKI